MLRGSSAFLAGVALFCLEARADGGSLPSLLDRIREGPASVSAIDPRYAAEVATVNALSKAPRSAERFVTNQLLDLRETLRPEAVLPQYRSLLGTGRCVIGDPADAKTTQALRPVNTPPGAGPALRRELDALRERGRGLAVRRVKCGERPSVWVATIQGPEGAAQVVNIFSAKSSDGTTVTRWRQIAEEAKHARH